LPNRSLVQRTCIQCATEPTLTLPATRWDAWSDGHALHALDGLDPDDRRWLTTMTCPDCYRHAITTAPAEYRWAGRCAGCGHWETFAVSTTALQAVHTGQLTAGQALPYLSADQRCLIEMHCHLDCYSDAVYGRPPGEPSPFAHLDQ